MEQLKPCPFCGRKIETFNVNYEGGEAVLLGVQCYCGTRIEIRVNAYFTKWDGMPDELTAIEKWNRRADDEAD